MHFWEKWEFLIQVGWDRLKDEVHFKADKVLWAKSMRSNVFYDQHVENTYFSIRKFLNIFIKAKKSFVRWSNYQLIYFCEYIYWKQMKMFI